MKTYPTLKSVSNQTLLDMYYYYRKEKDRYEDLLTKPFTKVETDYFLESLENTKTYLKQIELEILSRMFGMEID